MLIKVIPFTLYYMYQGKKKYQHLVFNYSSGFASLVFDTAHNILNF